MALQLRQTSSHLGSSLPLVSVWWGEDGETDGLRNLFLTLISSLRRYPLFLSSFRSFIHPCIPILAPYLFAFKLLKSCGDGMASDESRL